MKIYNFIDIKVSFCKVIWEFEFKRFSDKGPKTWNLGENGFLIKFWIFNKWNRSQEFLTLWHRKTILEAIPYDSTNLLIMALSFTLFILNSFSCNSWNNDNTVIFYMKLMFQLQNGLIQVDNVSTSGAKVLKDKQNVHHLAILTAIFRNNWS